MKRLFKVLFLSALATHLSCTEEYLTENTRNGVHTSGEEQKIELKWELPGVGAVDTPTRALSATQENTLNDVYVLAFDLAGELFAIRRGVDLSSRAGSTTTAMSGEGSFKATLPWGQYNYVVIANAAAVVESRLGTDVSLIADKGYDEVLSQLVGTIDRRMYPDGGTIPLWGETGLLSSSTAGDRPVVLTRALARVDLGVGRYQNGIWDGRTTSDQPIAFSLSAVYVVRPNNQYAVTPYRVHTESNLPTVPATASRFTVAQSQSLFCYEGAEIVAGRYTSASIYLPEAEVVMGGTAGDAHHTDRLALVVAGHYDENGDGLYTEPVTYYRLDFYREGRLFDVLRNHLYRFTVTDVKGSGYPDMETAYRSQTLNLSVEVADWNQEPFEDIHVVGKLFLKVQQNPVEFGPLRESRTVRIRTNLPDFGFFLGANTAASLSATAARAAGTAGQTAATTHFRYTLKKEAAEYEYTLLIECQNTNISSNPVSKTDLWTVKGAEVIAFPFTVDQRWSATDPTPRTVTVMVNDTAMGAATASPTSASQSDPVTITAAAKAGYLFERWAVESGGVSLNNATANPASFTMGTQAVTIRAYFKAQTEPLSVVSNNEDFGVARVKVPANLSTLSKGTKVTLGVVPMPGYAFSGWTVISENVTIAADSTFTMPAGLVSIRANFAAVRRRITVQTPALAGSGTAAATASTAAAGERVSVTATPANANYIFKGWTFTSTPAIAPAPVTTTNPTSFVVPQGDVSVRPVFARVYQMSAGVNQASWGTAIVSQSRAESGTAVTWTAAPKSGYVFVRWSGGETANPLTLNVSTADITRTATFEAIPTPPAEYTITIGASTPAEGGAAQADARTAPQGTPVKALASPATGYRFVRWTTSANITLPDPTANPASFTMPAAAVSLAPEFVYAPGGGISTITEQQVGSVIWARANVDGVGGFEPNPWTAAGVNEREDPDLCPSGWRMATGNDYRELTTLGTVSWASVPTPGVQVVTPGGTVFFPYTRYDSYYVGDDDDDDRYYRRTYWGEYGGLSFTIVHHDVDNGYDNSDVVNHFVGTFSFPFSNGHYRCVRDATAAP